MIYKTVGEVLLGCYYGIQADANLLVLWYSCQNVARLMLCCLCWLLVRCKLLPDCYYTIISGC